MDTNVFVALVDERDAMHATAKRDLARFYREGLAVTLLVLGEALFLMPRRHLRQRLALLLAELRPEPVELEAPWWSEVCSWIDRYAEHEPDLADAQLVALVTRDRRNKIWTYDREFRQIWKHPDGSALPVVGKRVGRRRR